MRAPPPLCASSGPRRATVVATSTPPSVPRPRLLRSAKFWVRALRIWGGYKTAAARIGLLRRTRGPSFDEKEAWAVQHARAGDEMLALCSDLKAFYAKVGQLVAMQAFVPEVIRAKLATLQSEMPLLPEAELHAALAASLPAGASLASTFARIDLGSALGSASIASVHYGELADARRTKVAVKIQLPAAEALMAGDLRNLRLLAAVLQKTDLKFDLVRPVDELRAQIASEFDFEAEAAAMRRVHSVLKARRVRGVRVPLPIPGLVSRTLLVMEYMDGLPLSRVERKAGKRAVRRLGRVVMRRLGEAYGAMILEGPSFFQADPHPGNLLVLNRKMDIALIDYGQTKSLSEAKRLAFAGLVDAMARRSPVDVAKGMKALGIVVEDVPERNGMAKRKIRLKRARGRSIKALSTGLGPAEGEGGNVSGGERGSSSDGLPPEQSVHVAVAARRSGPHLTSAEKLAYTMFDTAEYEGVSSNPFADESALRTATVSDLPKDLFFLLRTTQIMKGICAATGNSDFSLARYWAGTARAVLREARH